MYAIIETGGKQIRVEKDAVIFVEKLEANEGDTVTFDKVLYANGKFGKPFVEGAKVTGCLLYTSPSPRDRSVSRMPSSA